ncbi:MAG: hypothetical protein D6695_09160 [Planctomycetota bacterium]|nr:MAG: hypothetical protein D6695_09160 [Planctomycetota bacterium]
MTRIQTVCWLRPDQVQLVRALAERAGLEIVAAGTDERGRSAALAGEFGPNVRPESDLRALLTSVESGLVLLADPGEFGSEHTDAAAVAAARTRGVAVCSLEPMPNSVSVLDGSDWAEPVDGTPLLAQIVNVASPESTRSIDEAHECMDSFGEITAIAVSATAGPEAGSLGARVYAAMNLLFLFAGLPEIISAAIVQPRKLRSARVDRLTHMHGTLTASVRLSDHRAATILASNQSQPWHHGITILGPGGRLRIWDEGFVWTDPSGRIVDELRLEVDHQVDPAARHLGERIGRAMESPRPRTSHGLVLAMAETALLSARTGNAESPATLLRVAGSIEGQVL